MLIPTIVLASLVAPTQAPNVADAKGAALERRLRSVVEAYHAGGEFHGVALVAREGEVVGRFAVGLANRAWEVPMRTDAVFPIASLTKQFTAVLVMQAVELGELSLEDTLDLVLPEFPAAVGERVQVQHLLLHSGGFRDPDFAYYLDPREDGKTDAQVAREYLYDQQPDFAAGSEFRYSNADYHLLGAILEARTGQTFEQLVEQRIVEPLGLLHTRLAHQDVVRAGRPTDYVRDGEGWVHPTQLRWSHWQAAGGLESSLDDLHRWNRALSNFELLTPESTERMLTAPGRPDPYVALGSWVYARPLPGTNVTLQLAERRGALGGHALLNAFDRERGEWVILYSNHGDRTLDTLAYAPCLPLDLFSALHDGELARGAVEQR